jgi:hypothetical protein
MAILLTGCGDDVGSTPAVPSAQQETAGEGDLESYCSLTLKLKRAGEKFLERELDGKATQEDVQKVRAEFVATHQVLVKDFLGAAPPEIRADLEVLFASLKEGAALDPDVDPQQTRSAEKKVQHFEKENC